MSISTIEKRRKQVAGGRFLLDRENFEGALRLFQRVERENTVLKDDIEKEICKLEILSGKSEAYLRLNRYEEALRCFEEIEHFVKAGGNSFYKEFFVNDKFQKKLKGEIVFGLGRYKEALDLFSSNNGVGQLDGKVAVLKAKTLIALEEYEEAAKIVITLDDDNNKEVIDLKYEIACNLGRVEGAQELYLSKLEKEMPQYQT